MNFQNEEKQMQKNMLDHIHRGYLSYKDLTDDASVERQRRAILSGESAQEKCDTALCTCEVNTDWIERIEAAIPYLEKCDLILIMTVEPGFGGQKFMEDMMPKLRQLREWLDDVNPDCLLEVDGGVDEKTCAVCKESGADVLVAGSAYFKATDRAAFVKVIQG